MTAPAAQATRRAVVRAVKAGADAMRPPPGPGDWLAGVVMGAHGVRRYRLYRPAGLGIGERVPLLVMLHGCGQDAKGFAMLTRMNALAERERCVVLYPEQDRMANAHGCWNWFDTDGGRAQGEAALIMKAIDQACVLYPVDRARVAVAGLSAGASMAALLATRHPERFRAVVMHSGVPPGAAHSSASAIGAMRGRRSAAAPGVPTAPAASAATAASTPARRLPPLLVIHGGADTVVSVRNAHAAVSAWAAATGAVAGGTRAVQRGQRHAMNVTDFRHRRHTVARLVEIPHLGHAWSGGAASQPYSDSAGPDASRLAWAFVAQQLRDGAA